MAITTRTDGRQAISRDLDTADEAVGTSKVFLQERVNRPRRPTLGPQMIPERRRVLLLEPGGIRLNTL